MGLKHWLKEGFDPSGFPAPSGLDGLRYLRRKRGVDCYRPLRNLTLRNKVPNPYVGHKKRYLGFLQYLARGPGQEPHLHSLASAYADAEAPYPERTDQFEQGMKVAP